MRAESLSCSGGSARGSVSPSILYFLFPTCASPTPMPRNRNLHAHRGVHAWTRPFSLANRRRPTEASFSFLSFARDSRPPPPQVQRRRASEAAPKARRRGAQMRRHHRHRRRRHPRRPRRRRRRPHRRAWLLSATRSATLPKKRAGGSAKARGADGRSGSAGGRARRPVTLARAPASFAARESAAFERFCPTAAVKVTTG